MLEALGNLGDFIGGLAVVVTLIYLAIQVRQNTIQLRKNAESAEISGRDANIRAMSRFRSQIIGSADVAALYNKGRSDRGSLDTDERVRFDLLLSELFSVFQTTELRARHMGDDETRLIPVIRSLLRSPGIQEWWTSNKSQFRPDFVSVVESQLVPPSQPAA